MRGARPLRGNGMKLTKRLSSPIGLILIAVFVAGVVLGACVIWSQQSNVDVIQRGNVIVTPGLSARQALLTNTSMEYTVAVNNTDSTSQTYTLSITSNNANVTAVIGMSATQVILPHHTYVYHVIIYVGPNAGGAAQLTWTLTQG